MRRTATSFGNWSGTVPLLANAVSVGGTGTRGNTQQRLQELDCWCRPAIEPDADFAVSQPCAAKFFSGLAFPAHGLAHPIIGTRLKRALASTRREVMFAGQTTSRPRFHPDQESLVRIACTPRRHFVHAFPLRQSRSRLIAAPFWRERLTRELKNYKRLRIFVVS